MKINLNLKIISIQFIILTVRSIFQKNFAFIYESAIAWSVHQYQRWRRWRSGRQYYDCRVKWVNWYFWFSHESSSVESNTQLYDYLDVVDSFYFHCLYINSYRNKKCQLAETTGSIFVSYRNWHQTLFEIGSISFEA